MKRLSEASTSKYAVRVGLALLFYLSYRYPLQINFSGTSQVYADTPLWLQLPKFLIGLAAGAFLLWLGRARPISRSALAYVVGVLALQAFATVKTVMTGEGDYSDAALWTLVALVLALHVSSVDPRKASRLIGGLLYVSFAVDAVQVFLFFATGRLPALAWEGSLSVRFGSFLDDPNGFSVLCFLFLGWALRTESRRQRWLQVAMVIAMLIAAQSLTALGILALLVGLRLLVQALRMEGIKPILIAGACIAIGLFLYATFEDTFAALYELKQGSIDQHGSFDVSKLVDRSALQLMLGSFSFEFFESWWLQAYVNFGLPYLFVQLGLAAYTLRCAWLCARASRDPASSQVFFALVLFQLTFVMAAGNLPLYAVFPVNMVYQLTCFLTVFGRFQDTAARRDARLL